MSKAKKYYAVRKGLVPGIYTSWGECQQNVNGYPGAEYQGFSTEEEAKAFLNSVTLNIDSQNNIYVRDNGIVANGINKNDLENVLDLLKEDFPDLILTSRDIPYATQYELEIAVPNKQKLTVDLYESKKKIWISGRKEDLFSRLTIYIVELLEIDEIPNFLNIVHSTDVDKDEIKSEFITLFPNSHDKLPTEISKYLHQAVFNLHVSDEVFVANYLVEPALRPLEGILKLALKTNNIPIRQKGKSYDSFYVFEEEDGKYKLKEQFIRKDHSKDLLNYLSKCYTYFHNNRHTMFHWEDPTEDKDTTRILNTVEEAIPIIRDSISLIDEYYTIS